MAYYLRNKNPMIDYWFTLSSAEKTFTGIGLVSSLILTIQMAMVMIGGAVDMPDAEISETGEGGASGIFSIRTIGAFFAGFGWAGVAMLQGGNSTGAATFVATLTGIAFMGIVIYLMSYLHSLREKGPLITPMLLEMLEIFTSRSSKRKGMGQVEVMVQGRLKVVQAVTDHDKKIANRAAVRVTDTVDSQTLLVAPLEEESTS